MASVQGDWSKALNQKIKKIQLSVFHFSQSSKFTQLVESVNRFNTNLKISLKPALERLQIPEVQSYIAKSIEIHESISEEDWDQIFQVFNEQEHQLLDRLYFDDLWPALMEARDREGESFDRGTVIEILYRKLSSLQHVQQMEQAQKSEKNAIERDKVDMKKSNIINIIMIMLALILTPPERFEQLGASSLNTFKQVYQIYLEIIEEIPEEDSPQD